MNILIVDNIAMNRRLLRAVLEAEDFDVCEAANGIEALAMLERTKVDAIISDILMPKMDGYRFCMEVRRHEKFRPLPFLVYTSTYTSPSDEKMSLDLGADRFLKKPAPAEELVRALREAIEEAPHREPKVQPESDEGELLEQYNQRLVEKLTKKNDELEAQTQAMQKSEQQLRLQSTALETAANAIIITDRRGFILWSNPSFTQMTGYGPQEAIGKTPRILKSGQHDDAFYKSLWASILAGKSWHGELTNKRKDGSLYYGEQTITPVLSEGGDITHFVGIMNDVTDRKRAEAELRESQERLRIVTDNARTGLVLVDPGRHYMFTNAAYSEILGLPAGNLVGRRVADVLPEVYEKQIAPRLDRAFAGERVTYELHRGGPTGEHHYSVSYEPIRNGGNVAHVVVVIVDVTERKRAEESSKIFRALLDHSHDIIEVIDPETSRFLDVNEGSCRAHGYSREEMLKLSVLDVEANFNDHSQWTKVVAHIRRSGFLTISGNHRRKDGSTFPVEVNCQYVELDRPYLLAVVRDVTERKQAEETLRASEERFRQIAENITEVFWMTDPSKNQMLYVSPAYEKIWGRTCESLYRSPGAWAEAIHPEDRERIVRAAMTKQVTGEYNEIYRVNRPDGTTRWIHDRAYPIRNEAGQVYRVVGTAGDITQQQSLEKQLRQAQKMEAIGTLAGGIAHDFNNILAAINGFTDLAKMESKQNPDAMEYLDEVSKAGWRATDLVRQILTFSRQQEQERKRLQLRHVVGEAFKLLRATIPTTVQFNISLSTNAPVVLADATQIHQIIMNLGTNAAHAMRDQPGRLEVKLAAFDVDVDFAATHADLHPGRYTRLSVSDSGHGMDRATLERIFEPFFTTKAPGEGTGLGLAVVHGIMQAHEGCITVYSQPGQGTTFHLYFPALVDAEAEAVSGEVEIPRGNGERILFLDDEPPLVKLGQKMLERLGYTVETRSRPADVLALVRAQPDAFDLVITDLTMPGMTGTELAKHLLKIRADLPIILTTGYAARLTNESVRDLGISALLLKPLSRQSLGEAVHRMLNSTKTPGSP